MTILCIIIFSVFNFVLGALAMFFHFREEIQFAMHFKARMGDTQLKRTRTAIKGFIGEPNTENGKLMVDVPTGSAKRIVGFN